MASHFRGRVGGEASEELEEIEIKSADESLGDKKGLFTTPFVRHTSFASHGDQEKRVRPEFQSRVCP